MDARRPALPGFIVRRCFAARAETERETVIAACRAELDWARADWRRIANDYSEYLASEGPHPADECRLPHERAAAVVLDVWGHLHPHEARMAEAYARMQAQRAHGWDHRGAWRDAAWYATERRKLKAIFARAVENYRKARRAVQ